MKIVTFIFLYTFSSLVISDPYKVVYQLNESEKASVLVSSINELLSSGEVDEIEVVVHGPAIKVLSKKDKLLLKFTKLLDQGVRIGVCSTSMLKNIMKHELILDRVHFVKEGGVLRIIKLQKLGYQYIKI